MINVTQAYYKNSKYYKIVLNINENSPLITLLKATHLHNLAYRLPNFYA